MWSNVIIEGEGPIGRHKHAVALANDELYLYGGRAGTKILKDLWKLELRGGKWTELISNNSPPALQEHTIVHHNGKLYLFGGEIGFRNQTPLWIYNIKDGEWRQWKGESKAKTPSGRRGHVAAIHAGYMLIHGGYGDLKGSLGDLWAFHFETESWHLFYNYCGPSWFNNVPSARHNHGAQVNQGYLYVFGGMCDLEEKSDFWKFNLGSKCWIQIKSKPQPGPLKAASITKAFSSMFLFGGERNGKLADEFWKFSFETETWDKIMFHGCKPSPRYFPAIIMLPAIVKVKNVAKNSNNEEDGSSYWWDYNALPEINRTSNVQNFLRKFSGTNTYQALNSEADGYSYDLESPEFPKRSESTTCFKSSSTHHRVQKSNSVRFSEFKNLHNSTSDYSSMETLEELKRVGFENPNYRNPEVIEMDTLSELSPESPQRIQVTTPNYMLLIGGFESMNSHMLKSPLSIWRLRVSQELFIKE